MLNLFRFLLFKVFTWRSRQIQHMSIRKQLSMQVFALFLDAHLGPGAEVPEETPAVDALLDRAAATAAWVSPFSAALGAPHAAIWSQCVCEHVNHTVTECEASGTTMV